MIHGYCFYVAVNLKLATLRYYHLESPSRSSLEAALSASCDFVVNSTCDCCLSRTLLLEGLYKLTLGAWYSQLGSGPLPQNAATPPAFAIPVPLRYSEPKGFGQHPEYNHGMKPMSPWLTPVLCFISVWWTFLPVPKPGFRLQVWRHPQPGSGATGSAGGQQVL